MEERPRLIRWRYRSDAGAPMRRHALVLAVVVVLILSGCSTGQRVDLGDAASDPSLRR